MKKIVSLALALCIILSIAVFSFANPSDYLYPDIEFYEPDMYKVGTDIEAGEYYIVPIDDFEEVYFSVTSDSNGDDILENSFQLGAQYITVEDGQYFSVEGGEFALASLFPSNEYVSISADGMYLVGKDIEAGEYKLSCVSPSGAYYCIYDDSIPGREIVNNQLFEKTSYVTVADGQYLNVEGCIGKIVS